MKILFISLARLENTEQRGIYSDLVRELTRQGHFVAVVSPVERRERQKTTLRREKRAWFLQVRTLNNQKVGFIEKGVALLSTPLIMEYAIKRYFKGISFDLILYATPPITLAGVIRRLKKHYRAHTYLMLKDIWPQTAVDLGAFPEGSAAWHYFSLQERLLYRYSDFIGCMSLANCIHLLKHHHEVPAKKVELCPNAIEPVPYTPVTEEERRTLRRQCNIPEEALCFIYGGNLGLPQGIPDILRALEAVPPQSGAFFLILGSGTEYENLRRGLQQKGLTNVRLLPSLPRNEYSALLKAADAGLVFLNPAFSVPNIPSRVLDYMQAGIPVLAAVDNATDLPRLIEEGGFGLSCAAAEPEHFAALVAEMAEPQKRAAMGAAGRAYLENNWTSKHAAEIILKHFQE